MSAGSVGREAEDLELVGGGEQDADEVAPRASRAWSSSASAHALAHASRVTSAGARLVHGVRGVHARDDGALAGGLLALAVVEHQLAGGVARGEHRAQRGQAEARQLGGDDAGEVVAERDADQLARRRSPPCGRVRRRPSAGSGRSVRPTARDGWCAAARRAGRAARTASAPARPGPTPHARISAASSRTASAAFAAAFRAVARMPGAAAARACAAVWTACRAAASAASAASIACCTASAAGPARRRAVLVRPVGAPRPRRSPRRRRSAGPSSPARPVPGRPGSAPASGAGRRPGRVRPWRRRRGRRPSPGAVRRTPVTPRSEVMTWWLTSREGSISARSRNRGLTL